jgi:predicted membrane GTPase involved in stress response
VEGITIGETVTSAETPMPLPHIQIDEPTIAMARSPSTRRRSRAAKANG